MEIIEIIKDFLAQGGGTAAFIIYLVEDANKKRDEWNKREEKFESRMQHVVDHYEKRLDAIVEDYKSVVNHNSEVIDRYSQKNHEVAAKVDQIKEKL